MNRIKELRNEKNLSLSALAKKVGVTHATLSRYETGIVKTGRIELWQKLADFFGVDIAYIQGFSDIKDQEDAKHQFDDLIENKWGQYGSQFRIPKIWDTEDMDVYIARNPKPFDNYFEELIKLNPIAKENKLSILQKRRIAFIFFDSIQAIALLSTLSPEKVDSYIEQLMNSSIVK
ncbi:Transcriptional regulator [Fructobacillus tropaeoli]|uniref:helix-turn-helix domain-containing protein n=1 Tax=Fructobacillus tropaeoli TaxID=709323 RepID=UPI002DB377C6|nr:Transcriptional regulator [Fructobacillus tropaeoli]